MTVNPEDRPRRHPTAGFSIWEGDAIIVLPDGARITHLNRVGSRVWELMDGERTVSQIADVICGEFETTREQAERDVRDFIGTLAEHGMLG